MRVIGKRVVLSDEEINESMMRRKRFQEYHSKHQDLLNNVGGRFLFIFNYLKSEGWDFSKKGQKAMPKYLRNNPKHPYFYVDEHGEIVYL